jgi:hypothetical protein
MFLLYFDIAEIAALAAQPDQKIRILSVGSIFLKCNRIDLVTQTISVLYQ